MNEIWKDIEGLGGRYQVSNTGQIRDLVKKRLCWLEETQRGYLRVSFQVNRKRVRMRVHRIVASHFLPNTKNLPQVDHINGNRKDNRVENLRWVDGKTNCQNVKERNARKPVAIVSANGEIIASFTSETKAAHFLGVNRTGVSAVCNGYQHTTSGLILKHL